MQDWTEYETVESELSFLGIAMTFNRGQHIPV